MNDGFHQHSSGLQCYSAGLPHSNPDSEVRRNHRTKHFRRVRPAQMIVRPEIGRKKKESPKYITVGIHLGLRACTLKLRKERVPAWVCLSKPFLKHRTRVEVPVSTTHFLISTAAQSGMQETAAPWPVEYSQRYSRGARGCAYLFLFLMVRGATRRGGAHRRSEL